MAGDGLQQVVDELTRLTEQVARLNGSEAWDSSEHPRAESGKFVETAEIDELVDDVPITEFDSDTSSKIREQYRNLVKSHTGSVRERLANTVGEITSGTSVSLQSGGTIEVAVSGANPVLSHEVAHAVHRSNGVSGGIYADESESGRWMHDWEGAAVAERSALRGNGKAPDVVPNNKVPGLDQYRSRVEEQIADSRTADFTPLSSEGEASDVIRNELSEGSLLRTGSPLSRQERFESTDDADRVYRVVSKTEVSPDDADEVFRAEVTLEDAAGEQFEIVANRGSTSDTSTGRVEGPDGKLLQSQLPTGYRRQSPDGWGVQSQRRDPDEYLGESDATGDDAVREVFRTANEAWYRQAVINREYSQKALRQMTIGMGMYSAEAAQETIARMYESFDGGMQQSAAKALVRYHPDLLESIRGVRTLPDTFKQTLNDELETVGAEFRFDTGTESA